MKVVEDVRLHTVSVTSSAMPKQVPEGDLKKIKAVSWLLDHPGTQAEAVIQVRGKLCCATIYKTVPISIQYLDICRYCGGEQLIRS